MKVTFILLSYNFFVYAMDGFSRNYLGRYGMGFVDENQGFDVGEDYEINICNNNRHGPCYVVMGGRDVGMANSGLTNIEQNSWPWPWSYEHMIGLPVSQGTLKQRNLLSGIPATHRPPRPRNLLSDCKTTGGQKCVFPFTWRGVAYDKCTQANHNKPWCATKTDFKGRYVKGKWGDCSLSCLSGCKTTKGQACVFPFTYKGTTYDKCTKVNGHKKPWCSTETDAKGQYISGYWGYCSLFHDCSAYT